MNLDQHFLPWLWLSRVGRLTDAGIFQMMRRRSRSDEFRLDGSSTLSTP